MIDVEYQNMGSITANRAEARLSTYNPLSSSDTLAYLGNIPPGGKVTAHYAISAASGATPGTYPLNTEVRYRDELDNSQISDTFTAPVTVAEPSATIGLRQIPVVLTLLVLIVIGTGYYTLVMRKKK